MSQCLSEVYSAASASSFSVDRSSHSSQSPASIPSSLVPSTAVVPAVHSSSLSAPAVVTEESQDQPPASIPSFLVPSTAIIPSVPSVHPSVYDSDCTDAPDSTRVSDIFQLVQSIQPDVTRAEFTAAAGRVQSDAAFGLSEEAASAWGVQYFVARGTSERIALDDAAASDASTLRLSDPDPIFSLASQRFQASYPDRLNPDRVREATGPLLDIIANGGCPPDSAFALPVDWSQFIRDIQIATLFGTSGIPIHVDPSWSPSASFGPCPAKYRRVHSAINAHVLGDRANQFCVLLPMSFVSDYQQRAPLGRQFHIQNFGLAAKNGKPQGRLTCNCSGAGCPLHRRSPRFRTAASRQGVPPPVCPLNTDFVVTRAIELYGEINHPTLVQIIRTILRAAALYGWDNLVIFKDDLMAFYRLLSFDPRDVHKMSFQAFHPPTSSHCQWVVVGLSGNFGWSALPMAMEVITRLLRVLIGWLISGFMLMYVDDIMIITSRAQATSDRAIALAQIAGLLGPHAHAPEKYESTDTPGQPRKIDILGWCINLDTRTVSVAYKNQVRALHWFMAVDISKPVHLEERERLCSLAERYSAVFPELRVLMSAMYAMLGGKTRANRGLPIPLPPRSRLAIDLWRTFLMSSEIDRDRGLPLGRPLSAFGIAPPAGILEFDGSLDGLGWRLWCGSTHEWVTAAYFTPPPNHLPARNSSYQNTMELTALAFGLLHALSLGWRDCTLHIRGDSDTVLHWAKSTNFRSSFVVASSALLIAVCKYGNIHIGDAEWLSTTDNFVCDALSRNDPASADARGASALGPSINLSNDPLFQSMCEACSPARSPVSTLEFFAMWARFRHSILPLILSQEDIAVL